MSPTPEEDWTPLVTALFCIGTAMLILLSFWIA
jgi:hypothetical protein